MRSPLPALVHNSLVSRSRSGNRDPATQQSNLLDLLGALICVGLLALTLAGRSGVPRLLLALAFVAYVPGRAIVSNWPLIARWSEVVMSMIFSVVGLGLIATVALWVHFWHPVGLFQVEAVLSLAGLVLGAARRHRHLPAGAVGDEQSAPVFTGKSRNFRGL
jgi:uncharacterized membrane protein